MQFQLGDIFIGNFAVSQVFGARPEVYGPRYGLKGHNGVDFACPTMTPVLAAAGGWVSESGFDTGGYGNYIKVVHDGYFTIYAHLNDRLVNFKDKVVVGQILGHSNNSGFSDAPHLHFGVAPCDINGIKTEVGNGFSGYINPMGDRCQWNIKNLTEPIVPSLNQKPDVAVPSVDFVRMVTEGTNFKVVAAYFNLSEMERLDPKGGEKVVSKIIELVSQRDQARQDLERLGHTPTPVVEVPPVVDNLPDNSMPPADNQPQPTTQEVSVLFTDISVLLKKLGSLIPFLSK